MRIFVQQERVMCDFTEAGSNSWVILSPIEQSIKKKIEAVGVPLKDWDIQINYGIKTGCNEAFIISTKKKDEILANCQSDEERQRTEELIRPILRGRDIKRYGYEWAKLWLIATFPSRHYDIEQYPAVKEYLLSFSIERLEQTGIIHEINGKKFKSRKKTNNKWFETQDSISYWDLFFQPHICWKAVGRNLTFSIVPSGTFLTAPASFISAGSRNDYILAYLCSKVGRYYIYENRENSREEEILLNIQSLIRFPIPPVSNPKIIENSKVLQNHFSQEIQETLDSLIYDSYGFSKEEIEEIERC